MADRVVHGAPLHSVGGAPGQSVLRAAHTHSGFSTGTTLALGLALAIAGLAEPACTHWSHNTSSHLLLVLSACAAMLYAAIRLNAACKGGREVECCSNDGDRPRDQCTECHCCISGWRASVWTVRSVART